MSNFLMIENPGEAPTEAFFIFGVSTTRYAGNEDTVGQFGSGSKQAVNLLLREQIPPTVYCGKTKIEFFTKPKVVNDGLTSQTYQQVCARVGTRSVDLNFVLDYGSFDWKETRQALQEFVSNAIDRSIREQGSVDAINIELVENARAKSGYTRVFIPLAQEVKEFYDNLDRHYLHFRRHHELKKLALPKREPGKALVYKRGVYIRTVDRHHESLFDYNLENLELDESRNVSDYAVMDAAAKAFRKLSAREISAVITALVDGREFFEKNFSKWDLCYEYDLSPSDKEELREQWQAAWVMKYGTAVLCRNTHTAELVKHKGYPVIVLDNESWYDTLLHYGVTTEHDVLVDFLEKEGKVVLEASQKSLDVVQWIWERLDLIGETHGKALPEVKEFVDKMDAGQTTFGRYSDGVVYLNQSHVGDSQEFKQTVLEEIAHHITGSTDLSRDFQDYAFRVAAKLMGSI